MSLNVAKCLEMSLNVRLSKLYFCAMMYAVKNKREMVSSPLFGKVLSWFGTVWHSLAKSWHGLAQPWHGLAQFGMDWHALARFVIFTNQKTVL